MTIKELIELLKDLENQDAKVVCFDDRWGDFYDLDESAIKVEGNQLVLW